MPFNLHDLQKSLDLLERHATRGDAWVKRAWSFRCPIKLKAFLCLCRQDNPKSDLDPDFNCQLQKNDVLLMFANEYRDPLRLAFSLEVSGKRHPRTLMRNGSELPPVIRTTLRPKLSHRFGGESIESYLAVVNPDSDANDTVTVTARFVPDHGINDTIVPNLVQRGAIDDMQSRWQASVDA